MFYEKVRGKKITYTFDRRRWLLEAAAAAAGGMDGAWLGFQVTFTGAGLARRMV